MPLLFVDVNLGQGLSERIVVFEGDESAVLAMEFAEVHSLNEEMQGKLKALLDAQIQDLLTRPEGQEPENPEGLLAVVSEEDGFEESSFKHTAPQSQSQLLSNDKPRYEGYFEEEEESFDDKQ